MKISFNPISLIQGNVANSKVDFVKNYGNYAANYNELTLLGEQKHTWFYFIVILSAILSGILFYMSREEKDAKGNTIQPTTSKKIYKILAWLSLGIFIVSVIYSGYMYFFIYSPQYNEWLKSLPNDARNKLNIIKSLNMIVNESQNYNNRNNSGIINIS
jgi:hypothetical protein